MQFCPRCSKPLLPQANYCRRCGYAVQRPRPPIPPRQRCHPFAGFIVVALAMSMFGSLMRSNRNYWHPVTVPQEMRWHEDSFAADRPLTRWSPVHHHRIFPETDGRLPCPPEEHHRPREYYRPFTVSPQTQRDARREQGGSAGLPAESSSGQADSDTP